MVLACRIFLARYASFAVIVEPSTSLTCEPYSPPQPGPTIRCVPAEWQPVKPYWTASCLPRSTGLGAAAALAALAGGDGVSAPAAGAGAASAPCASATRCSRLPLSTSGGQPSVFIAEVYLR